jgi:hypothetical protein
VPAQYGEEPHPRTKKKWEEKSKRRIGGSSLWYLNAPQEDPAGKRNLARNKKTRMNMMQAVM